MMSSRLLSSAARTTGLARISKCTRETAARCICAVSAAPSTSMATSSGQVSTLPARSTLTRSESRPRPSRSVPCRVGSEASRTSCKHAVRVCGIFEHLARHHATLSQQLTKCLVPCAVRPCPPDANPYMGRVRGFSNAYMSAGHNCWGILWAPVSGKAMSELILDGAASCVDLRPFDPARFAPKKQGGRGRKRGEQSVGEQW